MTKKRGPCETRTRDLEIMRLTRYRLRQGPALDSEENFKYMK